MRNEILKLRDEGKSYNEICTILGCSKSTVSYYCGKGQKEKNLKRNQKRRIENCLVGKIERWKSAKPNDRKKKSYKRSNKALLKDKVEDFQRRQTDNANQLGKRILNFTYRDVLNEYGEIAKCYLTGKEIDLKQPRTYQLDHIIPVSKGGTNDLENMGIACREANVAKSDLLLSEFILLCKDVLENFGYEVRAYPNGEGAVSKTVGLK